MCTALTFQSLQGENFFGRTMDFSHPIQPGIYIIPKNYQWNSLADKKVYKDIYSFIAIGQETNNMLGFFEGVNEKGFAVAALYFEGYADFNLPKDRKEEIASLDFVHFLLGNCSSIKDAKSILATLRIIGTEDPITKKVAPLHWIATDKQGKCIAIEQTTEGLTITDNPFGIFANSPDIKWHLTNLRNYMNLSTTQKQEANWQNVILKPFSQGGGTAQLPGGFTSPERFVRTAFLKTHTIQPENRSEAILTGFHILSNVFIPKGVVITQKDEYDYTKYISIMNTTTCEYYFKTYDNDQIMTVNLWNFNTNTSSPTFLGPILKASK